MDVWANVCQLCLSNLHLITISIMLVDNTRMLWILGAVSPAPVIVPLAWYVGLGVLLLACFHGRGRPHASCGRCRYAICGAGTASSVCSECGSEFAAVGIRPPREARKNVPWAIGLALVVIGGVGLLVLPGWIRSDVSLMAAFRANLLGMPLGSIAVGTTLIVATRRPARAHPSCMACGQSVQQSLGTDSGCPGCGRPLAEAGVRGLRGPSRPRVALGVMTIVLGLIVTLAWVLLSGYLYQGFGAP